MRNVVSLFDGMSCLQLALNRAGITPTKYFASEIDKYAMQVTMANFPNTIQIGDVRNVKGSDLGFVHILGGGSPCQSFSFAGKRKGMATKCDVEILTLSHYLELKIQNFEFEGQSYLFWEYMRILEELRVINPNIKFLLENVLMGEKWQKILTRAIGINPIKINSALLSAQNRQRLYWTNIASVQDGLFGDLVCSIPQPKDKGILLKDILETDVVDKYFLSVKMIDWLNRHSEKRGTDFKQLDGFQKSACITATANVKQNLSTDYIIHNTMPRSSKTGKGGTGPLSRNDGKTYCLDTGNTNAIEIVGAIKFGRTEEAKEIRKESMANGKDFTPFQAKEISNIDYEKMGTLTTAINKDNLLIVAQRGRGENNEQQLEPRNDGKTNCLTSVQKDNLVAYGCDYRKDEGFRVRKTEKSSTLMARAREDVYGTGLVMLNENQKKKFDHNPNTDKSGCLTLAQGRAGSSDEYMDSVSKIAKIQGNIRRLTPIECERLQTVSDNATKFCMSIDYLYICNEKNVIKKWLQSVELKSAIQILQTKKQDYVTNIIYDLKELAQLKEWLLIKQKDANIKNVLIFNKLLKDIVLLTTKDLSNTAHQNCLSKLFKEIKNVNIVINPLEKMEEEQEECVIDIIKTGLDTKTLYTQIINAMKLNQEGTMVELTVRNDTGLLWKFQSDETLNVAKLYITLTLIKKIIQSKIYTYSKIKMNIKSAISNLNILERNCLSVELLDLRTENISLNSDTQRYRMIGNGWTIDVISYIFSFYV